MNIHSSVLCVERRQWRFPRTKKRRIRRKWAKRPENFKQRPTAYRIGDALVCHPSIIEEIRKHCSP